MLDYMHTLNSLSVQNVQTPSAWGGSWCETVCATKCVGYGDPAVPAAAPHIHVHPPSKQTRVHTQPSLSRDAEKPATAAETWQGLNLTHPPLPFSSFSSSPSCTMSLSKDKVCHLFQCFLAPVTVCIWMSTHVAFSCCNKYLAYAWAHLGVCVCLCYTQRLIPQGWVCYHQ